MLNFAGTHSLKNVANLIQFDSLVSKTPMWVNDHSLLPQLESYQSFMSDVHRSLVKMSIQYQTMSTKGIDIMSMIFGDHTCNPFEIGTVHMSHEEKPPTFHYTGWLIGILIMVYYNPER